MGHSSSKSKEPLPELKLPIAVLPQFSTHTADMNLLLIVEPGGFFRDTFQTTVQDAITQQEIFSIGPISGGMQTLYSATRVPLLNMMTQSKFMGLNEYTCTNADTGLQVFHAMDTATFGMELTIIFKNAAGNMEPIRLQYKIDTWGQEAVITAWDRPIGQVAWHWGFTDPPKYKLKINPQVDAALLTISTMALHRMLKERERNRRRRNNMNSVNRI